MIDPRDVILQQHCPAVMVPLHGKFERMGHGHGHRFLVAADGLWLELRRPWLYLLRCVAPSEIPLPYGKLHDEIEYLYRARDASAAQDQFVGDAQASLPDECAAWAIHDARTGYLRYQLLRADHASPGGVTFKRPRLADHESLAIDFHSHGTMAPFFSATDDADDIGEVKIAVVVGTLDRTPTFDVRLCALGLFITS